MARLERQRLADVGERGGIVVGQVVDGRALVPGLGEVRLEGDDLVEDVERLRVVLLLDRLHRPGHQKVGGRAAGMAEAAEDLLLDPPAGRGVGILLELGEEVVERQLGDDARGEDRRRIVGLRPRRDSGEKRDEEDGGDAPIHAGKSRPPGRATSKHESSRLWAATGPRPGAQPWRAL